MSTVCKATELALIKLASERLSVLAPSTPKIADHIAKAVEHLRAAYLLARENMRGRD